MSEIARSIDWEAVERDYRAGTLSVRAISSGHGITEGAIRKRARRDGWQRDLSSEVRRAVRTKLVRTTIERVPANADAAQIVEAAAERDVTIILAHRQDIAKHRALARQLLAELETTKGLSLPTSVGVLKTLTETLRTLIALEREAFCLDAEPQQDPAERIAQMSPDERYAESVELVRRIGILVEVRG